MPSLLLIIVLSLGVLGLRRRWRRDPPRAVIANVFLWAILLNALWEMAQLPLFAGYASFDLFAALQHCAWYVLGDASIILSLYTLGAWGHRTWAWGLRLRRFDWLWLPMTGALAAVLIELLSLYFGRWQYGPDMPVLPGLAVGVLPVLQMGLLPVLSVFLANRCVASPERLPL